MGNRVSSSYNLKRLGCTPKPFCWLNVVGYELSYLFRHCLSAASPKSRLCKRKSLPGHTKNTKQNAGDWEFTIQRAVIKLKLKRFYPKSFNWTEI